MRIILLGTGSFAVPTLRALYCSEHEVVLAVTRPPRGRKPLPAPVQVAADELGVACWQPDTVNSDEARANLAALQPELFVVCDYGEILKSATLEVASLGGINLHGSLLPKYRGAAPVQWAVLNGESETGNTVIQMTPGLDAGPCVGMQRVTIDPDETADQLESRLAQLGAALVLDVVAELAAGTCRPVKQDSARATKAPRLRKEQGRIDWTCTAQAIKNQIRGLQPWPRAYCDWHRPGGAPLRLIVHRARVASDAVGATAPGTVLQAKRILVVATGSGALELLEIQPAGKRIMSAEDFLRGYPLQVGDRLVD